MRFSGVDWTILWKLHHVLFFWISFAVGIPIKALLGWRVGVGSAARAGRFATLASVVSSALNTWFPIFPISCAFILIGLPGHSTDANLSVPLVAATMGAQAALLDWVLFRVVMKKSVKGRLGWVLVANLLHSSIALSLGLVWVVHHPTMMIATANLARAICRLT
jgi:hypothetical protein